MFYKTATSEEPREQVLGPQEWIGYEVYDPLGEKIGQAEEIRVSQTPQLVGRSVSATVRRNPYWLLVKRRRGRLEVLTTSLADGRRVLPVFSFKEEAHLYLRRGIPGAWRVRQTEVGELLSLLYCLCNTVELVALDPVSDAETDVMDRLVSLERERFMDALLRSRAPVKGLPGAPHTTPALASPRGASA